MASSRCVELICRYKEALYLISGQFDVFESEQTLDVTTQVSEEPCYDSDTESVTSIFSTSSNVSASSAGTTESTLNVIAPAQFPTFTPNASIDVWPMGGTPEEQEALDKEDLAAKMAAFYVTSDNLGWSWGRFNCIMDHLGLRRVFPEAWVAKMRTRLRCDCLVETDTLDGRCAGCTLTNGAVSYSAV